MGNEIFEEIKKKYEKTKKFSFVQQDSFYVDKSFFEDMGKLIQIIETMSDEEKKAIKSINKIEELKSIKDYEIISFIDIIKTLCENREKINEIIERVVKE